MKISEKAYVNRTTILGHTVIDTVLLVAYLAEWLKGARTIGYVLIMAAFTVLPVAAEITVYRKNGESRAIRHIMGICYSSMYIFAIFTTNSLLTFTYAIPMYVIITLFSDIPYCTVICVGGFLSNVAYVVYYALTVGYTSAETADVEIRLACMALVGIYMIRTAVANKKISESNMERIGEQQNKVQSVLNDILAASDSMTEGISTVMEKMEILGESVTQIHQSMSEVSTGSNETAESIQNQLERTEQIQNHIVKVRDTAEFIEKNVEETTQVLQDGKQQMDDLAGQVEKAMQANSEVLKKMQELNEYTRQMNTIIETITSIANSTGMLALNASIEAARAGEAGRGFAVVAGQISGLANQTKTATVDITELIENISKELENVSQAVGLVTESNQANAERTREVAGSFVGITEGAGEIGRQTKGLMDIVISLEEANADIVDKIQTISAITEEVSAHSNETYSDCEANNVMVEEITRIVSSLNEEAEKLKNMR